MRIEMNDETERRLLERIGDRPGCVKLYYDIEDCGCNGVLILQILDEPLDTDLRIQGKLFEMAVDPQQAQRLDEVMRVEAEPGFPTFRISSDSGWYGSNVPVVDARE
ncbi:iron-sulfur cluster biosynthesis family protein [Gorillibacterium sp. sgz500922]|uniref:iron-sulfur cluster biosynthesis family protein n=1 Tax=Gorillibacterium sp. sgz500922 TaxID=3446694 RepID=UPI003F6779E5